MAYSKLKAEIRRHWRARALEEMKRRGMPIPPDFKVSLAEDGNLDPPDATRVAKRAVCLAAVRLRGLASEWDEKDQAEFHPQLMNWLRQAELDDELEPAERTTIESPPGGLESRAAINAVWRWEGAAVLAASLGRIELPPHDQTVDTKACGDACGLFQPTGELRRLFQTAQLTPSLDRTAYANRAISIHWRLRQHFNAEPKPLDFANYAAGVKWADFDLREVRLASGDLSINGFPITNAAESDVRTSMSIASERHIAANWLIGWNPVYSEVEIPT